MPDEIKIKLPRDGFAVIFNRDGEIEYVVDKKNEAWKGCRMSTETPKKVELLEEIAPVTLVKLKASPGHWCVHAGRLMWCPF